MIVVPRLSKLAWALWLKRDNWVIFAGYSKYKITGKKPDMSDKEPRFVGQNIQRVKKSFGEAY